LEKDGSGVFGTSQPDDDSQPIAITTTSHEIPQSTAVIVTDGTGGTVV